jgi:hypothetical protein
MRLLHGEWMQHEEDKEQEGNKDLVCCVEHIEYMFDQWTAMTPITVAKKITTSASTHYRGVHGLTEPKLDGAATVKGRCWYCSEGAPTKTKAGADGRFKGGATRANGAPAIALSVRSGFVLRATSRSRSTRPTPRDLDFMDLAKTRLFGVLVAYSC